MHLRLSRVLLIFWALTFYIALLPYVYASTETLRPNAVGDSSQNTVVGDTPGWKCVDETTSDSDTTYIRSITGDNEGIAWLDLYNIDATAIPVGSTINSFTVYMVVRSQSGTYKASFTSAVKKSGGAVAYAGSGHSPGTSFTTYSDVITGIAQSDLNTLQVGIQIISGYNPILEVCVPGRATQLYVIIDYTEVTATWNTITTWNSSLITRNWQTSGTWSEFLTTRSWQTATSWSNYLISRAWQNVAIWNINLLTLGWHIVTSWSILLLGEDPTTIIVILFLFSVVAFTCFGLYRRRQKQD